MHPCMRESTINRTWLLQIKLADQILAEDSHQPLFEVYPLPIKNDLDVHSNASVVAFLPERLISCQNLMMSCGPNRT